MIVRTYKHHAILRLTKTEWVGFCVLMGSKPTTPRQRDMLVDMCAEALAARRKELSAVMMAEEIAASEFSAIGQEILAFIYFQQDEELRLRAIHQARTV